MSLRRFLDTAYYILIEEYQRLGASLPDALEKTSEWMAHSFKEDTPRVDPSEAAQARQNEAAFREFKQLMGGVG